MIAVRATLCTRRCGAIGSGRLFAIIPRLVRVRLTGRDLEDRLPGPPLEVEPAPVLMTKAVRFLRGRMDQERVGRMLPIGTETICAGESVTRSGKGNPRVAATSRTARGDT